MFKSVEQTWLKKKVQKIYLKEKVRATMYFQVVKTVGVVFLSSSFRLKRNSCLCEQRYGYSAC